MGQSLAYIFASFLGIALYLRELGSSCASDTPGKAIAYFRWVNFARRQAPSGRKPLFINLDETALCYSFTGMVGTVVCEKALPPGKQHTTESATESDIRGHVTLITLITHDTEVQARLPQILLGNEHRFTLELLKKVKAATPSNVHLWRQQSAWNSHATMRRVLTTLSAALGALLKTRYVVLVLDVAGVHIHQTIHSLAKKLRIRLVFLPAKLTYLLQPCDTHLFRRFKHWLQEAFRQLRSTSESGVVTPEQWLGLIFRAVREVIQGVAWQHAFCSVGILDEQKQLAPWVLRQMGLSSVPALGSEPPSYEETVDIFPKRRRINRMAYVLWPEVPSGPATIEEEGVAHASASAAGAPSSSTSSAPLAEAYPPMAPSSSSSKYILRPRKAKSTLH